VVTATNERGVESATALVEVVDIPLAGLTATNDSPTALGSATTFTATITAGTNVTYTWEFGDGTSAAGAEVTHNYTEVGSYTAVVTVTNSGGVETDVTTVQIVDVPITGLAASSDSPTLLGSATTFTATITAGTNVTYTWEFGDGTSAAGAEVTHNYTDAEAGSYTATVTATNNSGAQSATTLVEVVDIPITGLEASNDSPTELGSVTFFTATIQAGTNTTYTWEFGDGTSGSGATTTHNYAQTGIFTATVTASNSRGTEGVSTVVQMVDVPITGLTASSDSPTELGSATTFTATITNGTNVTYTWEFGDGTSAAGAEVTHN
jgi:PKD repeat protein